MTHSRTPGPTSRNWCSVHDVDFYTYRGCPKCAEARCEPFPEIADPGGIVRDHERFVFGPVSGWCKTHNCEMYQNAGCLKCTAEMHGREHATTTYSGRCEAHGEWLRQDGLSVCPQCEDAAPEDYYATQPTNPKDRTGVGKTPVSVIPQTVIAEVGLAMMEGALKYGAYNWREAGVRGSVYVDAAWRHLAAWWEGEDDDPDSGLSHIVKAIAGLCVLRDAMIQEKFEDDRPPMSPTDWLQQRNAIAARIRAEMEKSK